MVLSRLGADGVEDRKTENDSTDLSVLWLHAPIGCRSGSPHVRTEPITADEIPGSVRGCTGKEFIGPGSSGDRARKTKGQTL